ncbi:coronin-7 isoform X1 [Drosophila busckii]|uniref:coronin-7 isoform X1 n=1 Tax=Drosophila busckii TaxID=30019 RepID=UPI00083EA2D5|nr:coronin-7 isoform X1 [Drosophila busckii]XP_017850355.1 coronin-7 isoform X1 [Drosophila busckii]XP_017850356.1 coronin-7 isoform X1 [Drosophila busckii]
MAWRFKASKYKNAAPIVPKAEACVREICVGSYQTYGNNIAASAAFMAFNWEHTGASVAVLPLDDCGRKSKTMPLLHGHTDTVTDLKFSPFHDGLLATASQDCLLKIWHIPEKGLEQSLSDPEAVFSHKQRRVETIGFHPTADGLMYSTAAGCVTLFDIATQKEIFSNNEHPEVIQSASWREDGTVLATSCKDKCVRIFDPRAAGSPIQMVAESHQSIKDSRVVWLGNQPRLLTTGFDAARLRQVIIRDIRNLNVPEKTLELDCSTGILMPLFDPDTNMLFLAGKGDTTINYLEITDKDPYLIEGLRHTGEQTKGACLVPKRALKVMEAEVNRVLQLTSNMVIPIMYQVPRKTYRDFHADLYPETTGYKTELIASEWLNGTNQSVPKMNLDPAKREHGGDPIIPRLGPKPFSSNSGDVSFDKVFAVPVAPGSHENLSNVGQDNGSELPMQAAKPDLLVEIEIKKQPEPAVVAGNGNANGVQKSLTTSERRKSSADDDESSDKIFEQNSESSENSTEGEDRTDSDLRHLTAVRSSIAERRRLYENRSKSQVDEKAQSPVPLRRESSKVEPHKSSHQSVGSNMLNAQAGSLDSKRISVPEGKLMDEHRRGNGNASGIKKSATEAAFSAASTKRTSTVFGKVSKFRHLKGTPGHKSTHIENLRNLSRQIPGECNGFHANHERVAVPLSGPGGKIAIFELSRPGRLPDGVIPSLVNGSNIMDFQWDPFDAHRLAVACDDGIVKLWRIDEGGLSEPTNSPQAELTAHLDKIYFIRFHPLAADVLLTASYDMTIKLWDLRTMSEKCALSGHTDQIFDFAWSPCGKLGASVCKDGKIRVYNPRKSETPIREGNGPVGTRGARITWAVEGQYIVCTGFDKVSERQISVYNAQKLNAPLNTASLDVSPSILIPYYDEDSSTLFVTGKGDSTIYCYEITDEEPYICPLSHHRCSSLHQGLSFITKNHCDVASVEFSKAYRLTNTTIEPLSFTVPRIKSELFQDDLFPPTRVTWSPTLSAEDWFGCNDKAAAKISLKPEGMDTLSSIQQVPAPAKKSEPTPTPTQQFVTKSDYESNKQQEIQKSVSARMEYNTKLEQDEMEGVDENEWQE